MLKKGKGNKMIETNVFEISDVRKFMIDKFGFDSEILFSCLVNRLINNFRKIDFINYEDFSETVNNEINSLNNWYDNQSLKVGKRINYCSPSLKTVKVIEEITLKTGDKADNFSAHKVKDIFSLKIKEEKKYIFKTKENGKFKESISEENNEYELTGIDLKKFIFNIQL